METRRICKQCLIEKPIEEYAISRTHHGGRKPICKECYNWNYRPEEYKQMELEWSDLLKQGLKRCACCKSILELSKFPIREKSRDGKKSYCYECQRVKGLERSRRPDVKQQKKLRESTPEFYAQLSEYRHNSDAYKNYLIEYRKTEQYKISKRNSDNKLLRKLRQRISTQIWAKLKLWGRTKQSEFNDYLGCSIEFFAHHLESLWTDGMDWRNYGRGRDKWHADHIIPCASFDLSKEEGVKKCFHYSNYQPLWEPENLRKSSKINGVRITSKHNRK